MDFKDSPEDAAFRDRGARVARRATRRRSRTARTSRTCCPRRRARGRVRRRAAGVAEEALRRRLGRDHVAEGVRRPRRHADAELHLPSGDGRATTCPSGIYLVPHGMVGPTIITHGTPGADAALDPEDAEGSEIWCQLWSEPGAGSDLASLQTKCERDTSSGDWVLNGQKVWTTGAQWSRWGLIITRTDRTLPKHRGLTVFVVDMHATRASTVVRCGRSPAAPTSTRCSSTTSASRTTSASATSTTAGASR